MKRFEATVEGLTPYSQSKHISQPKLEKETSDAYERRTWRDRLHTTKSGEVFIPPMAFKNCLSEAAKFLGIQIPGKGKSTYTKHFEAGVMVLNPLLLGIQATDVPGEEFFVPSDGIRGSGKRVNKVFPRIDNWGGTFEIVVLDETVTHDVLLRHLSEAGSLIGIGRFRPRNNGFYGRFRVVKLVEVKS